MPRSVACASMPETPSTDTEQDDRTARIRALNDQLHQQFTGGEILMTPGVSALAQDTLIRVIEAVRSFDNFARLGADIPRSTLIDWCGQGARVLRPLAELIKASVFSADRLIGCMRTIPQSGCSTRR